MQNGDEIFVPRLSEVVYVVGDVLEPGNYRHVEVPLWSSIST